MEQKMEVMMLEFKKWCILPNVHNTIDNIHVSISRHYWWEKDIYLKIITYFGIGNNTRHAQECLY